MLTMVNFNAEKIIKDIIEWTENQSNNDILFERPQSILLEIVNDDISLRLIARAASQLRHNATWWSNLFLKNLYEGNQNVSLTGGLMLDYKYWYVRLHTKRYDQFLSEKSSCQSVVSYFNVYPLFSLLLTFSRWEEALWLGDRIYRSNQDECFDVWPMDRTYAGFVLKLYLIMTCRLKPEDEVSDLPECGVYGDLFTYWNDTDKLRKSIAQVCDEYYIRTNQSMEKKLGIVEFYSRPYSVLPVAILALRSVRHKMGLETPMPLHPMLDSNFVANLPEKLPSPEDCILDKVIAAAGGIIPDIMELGS